VLDASYILPLRWSSDEGLADLTAYLRGIRSLVREVIVVDGSDADLFARHAAEFGPEVRHLRPLPIGSAMGKVDGVLTGASAAGQEALVVADDDVRYDPAALTRLVGLLEEADLVRPQNYFEPLAWHARLDTGRTLLNRVFSGDLADPAADFPGTLAVRRSTFIGMGGYDGDAMFENLELIRTVRAAGGTTTSPLDLYVARRPPSTAHFLSQRVRQAYDDFALPLRLTAELALLPFIAHSLLRRRPRRIAAAGAAIAAVAEVGRRRAGGSRHFPPSASVLAPAWALERSVSVWLALYARRFRGGVAYGGGRVSLAATPNRRLRRRLAARSAS
jgi:hypothetical protein